MNTKRRADCQLRHDWKERIIRIGDEQTSLQNQFDNFRNEYSDTHPRIEALETDVNALDGRLIIAESDIVEAEDRIAECENDIDSLEAEVDALDGRVSITETDITAAETRITACESDINSLESEVNSLDGRVSIAESDISDAEDRISACEADIDRIDAELVDKTGEINALANRMSLAEADIDTLDARVDGIDADLADKTGKINNLTNRMSLAEADIDNLDARVSGIETGDILLSQLNVDADKDWQGRTINNVNLNNATYGDYHIEPRFLGGEGLIFDGQPGFMNRDLKIYRNPPLPQYVEIEGAPHPIALTNTGPYGIGHNTNPEKLVRVSPGDRVTLTVTARALSESSEKGTAYLCLFPYDSNKEYVASKRIHGDISLVNDDIWREYSLTGIVAEDIYYISPYIFINGGRPEVTSQICDFKIYKDYNRNIAAKLATFDGVIIQDGGTVDGVDISTHTHDGTAVGGPKISYNNLADKPQVDLATHTHDGTAVGGPKIDLKNVNITEDKSFNNTKITSLAGINDLVLSTTSIEEFIETKKDQLILTAGKDQSDPIGVVLRRSTLGPVLDNDGEIDLGRNNARFRDLYLSGDVKAATFNGATINTTKTAQWDGKARPPVPFYRDMIGVLLDGAVSYSFGVRMGPIVPPGRIGCTPFTLWMEISGITPRIDLRLEYVFDDNSVGRSDPLPATEGQHHVELRHLLPTTDDYSTKNYIKDIRIRNLDIGRCTITASLKGFVY